MRSPATFQRSTTAPASLAPSAALASSFQTSQSRSVDIDSGCVMSKRTMKSMAAILWEGTGNATGLR